MQIIKVLQVANLFVGTVIGAGFATGKEITVYFKDSSPISLILGGIMLGFYCSLFLYIGKTFPKKNLAEIISPKFSKCFEFIVILTVFFMFSAMFSCAENLWIDLYAIKIGGILSAILCCIISILGISSIKRVNTIIVPLIIIMIIFVFVRAGNIKFEGNVSIIAPIGYGAMNIMTSGFLMCEEGKKLNKKEIILTGFICAIIFTVMLFMIFGVVKGVNTTMPFYDVACIIGLKNSAGLLIYFAVFTTMLSGSSLIIEYTNKYIKNKYLSAIILLSLSIPIKIFVGFENIVTYIYPIISFLGCLITFIVLCKLIQKHCKFLNSNKFKNKKSKKFKNILTNN